MGPQSPAPQTFTTVIRIAGINPYVDVPSRVVHTLGSRSRLPVLVSLHAASGAKGSADAPGQQRLAKDAARLKVIGRLAASGWFRSTILASRSGPGRLYLDTWMRGAAGVGVGDRVRVALRPDTGTRELPMPAVLRQALNVNAHAMAAWEMLPPSRQREILTYLNFLKTRAALEQNVRKTIADLVAKEGSSD